MRVLRWLISVAPLLFHISCSSAVCDRMITRDDVYILSEQPATYQQAEETCQSYGGNLAQISSQDERRFFEPHLRSSYISEMLIKVNISSKSDYYEDENLNFTAYKYRPINYSFADPTSLSGFGIPEGNELKSITLYKRTLTNFEQRLTFCWFYGRDSIRSCNSGWESNFLLYEGTPQSSNTIKIRHYFTGNNALTNISVFTGARSDVGQSNWFWNNGTMITDPTYTTSNTSVCQQMTWPLTYDDGINLRAKECGTGESHYICRVKFPRVQASVEEVGCDGTSLRLYFPNNPAGFFRNETIQVRISDGRTVNVLVQNSSATISNLRQRTTYSFQLTLQFKGCSVDRTINVTGKTRYGVPDPVTSATAANPKPNLCSVTWRKTRNEEDEISYKITSTSNPTPETIIVKQSSIPDEAQDLGGFMLHEIDLSGHGNNNIVSFDIQTVSSCGKTSESVAVNGTCISPMKPQSAGLTTTAIVGIIVGVVLISAALLTLLILVGKRNSRQRETAAMKMSDIANQPTVYERPINVGSAVEEVYVQPNEIFSNSNIYEAMRFAM